MLSYLQVEFTIMFNCYDTIYIFFKPREQQVLVIVTQNCATLVIVTQNCATLSKDQQLARPAARPESTPEVDQDVGEQAQPQSKCSWQCPSLQFAFHLQNFSHRLLKQRDISS